MDLSMVFIQQCAAHKVKADTLVSRVLEGKYPDTVEELDFKSNYLGSSVFTALMEVLHGAKQLRFLGFSANFLKTEGVEQIVTLARSLPGCLESLNLSHNPTLGFSAAALLIRLLKDCPNITHVDVSETGIAAGTQQEIQRLADTNRGAKELQMLRESATPTPDSPSSSAPYVTDLEEKASEPPPLETEAAQSPHSRDRTLPPGSSPKNSSIPEKKYIFGQMDENSEDELSKTAEALAKAENLKLKVPIIDHEEVSLAIHSKLVTKCPTKRDLLANRHSKGNELLERFEVGNKWASAPVYTHKQLVAEAGLGIPYEEVVRLHAAYAPTLYKTEDQVKHMLDEVLEKSTGRRRVGQIVEELKAITRTQAPGSEEYPGVVTELWELLHIDKASIEQVEQMLAKTDHKGPILLAKCDQSDSSRDLCMKQEDFEKAEMWHDATLKQLEELLDIQLERIMLVQNNGPLYEAKLKCESLATDALEMLKPLGPEAEGRIANAREDASKLEQKRVEEVAKFEDAKTKHMEYQRRNREALVENSLKQGQLWENITSIYEQLRELGEERMVHVEGWIQQVERIERTKAEHGEVLKVIEKHKQQVSCVQSQSEAALDVLRVLEEFIHSAAEGVRQTAEATILNTEELLLTERKNHLAYFRRYYISLGELLYRKETRLSEMERSLQQLDRHISLCVETFDPNVNRYRDQRKELEKVQIEVKKKVGILRDNGAKATEDFKPTQEYLVGMGVNFTSPIIEMHEQLAERKQKAIGVFKSATEFDKQLLDTEAKGVTELSENAKRARLAGTDQVLEPLSKEAPSRFKKLESYTV